MSPVPLSALPLVDVFSLPSRQGECVFDPELHDGPEAFEEFAEWSPRVDVAREVCASCPLLDACRAAALRALPERGVWAGMTPRELLDQAIRELPGSRRALRDGGVWADMAPRELRDAVRGLIAYRDALPGSGVA